MLKKIFVWGLVLSFITIFLVGVVRNDNNLAGTYWIALFFVTLSFVAIRLLGKILKGDERPSLGTVNLNVLLLKKIKIAAWLLTCISPLPLLAFVASYKIDTGPYFSAMALIFIVWIALAVSIFRGPHKPIKAAWIIFYMFFAFIYMLPQAFMILMMGYSGY